MFLLQNIIERKFRYSFFFLLSLLFIGCSSTGNLLPKWFNEKDTLYPDSKYISTIGEGASIQLATENALSQISLYFDTSVSVNTELSKYSREAEYGDYYRSAEKTEIKEESKINSKSKFYCVSFSSPVRIGNLFYILAYIDREEAVKTYEANIQNNTELLRNLIQYAEMTDNPFYCLPAVSKGISIARETSEIIKNLRVVMPSYSKDFSESEKLVQRMNNAFNQSRGKMSVRLEVQSDWSNLVFHTLSGLMESNGFSITSDKSAACLLKAEVFPNRTENDAGIFLTCAIKVNAIDSAGNLVFSYTRNFERQGAPVLYEDVAWRKSFNAIADELNSSFIKEFNTKMVNG